MKKILSFTLAMVLMLSIGTSVFASEESSTQTDVSTYSSLDANNPEKINEALASGQLQVSEQNPEDVYVFPDGSVLRMTLGVVEQEQRDLSTFAAAATRYTASVSMSGDSAVGGFSLWTYTLNQTYDSDGSKVTWYEASPYGTFSKPLISLWGIDSETLSVTSNPGYPGGIWATGTIKLSWDIWEGSDITPVNIKLTLSIKGNGTYVGYTAWL